MIRLDIDSAGVPTGSSFPQLTVRSWFIDGVNPDAPKPFSAGLPSTPVEFLAQLPIDELSCWVRSTSGLVGFGRALRMSTSDAGADRFAALSRAWKQTADQAIIIDEVELPGSGLVGFTSIVFADDSAAASVIDVPRFLMGRRDGRVWLTSVSASSPSDDGADGLELIPTALRPPRDPRVLPGAVSAAAYESIVAQASARMSRGGSAAPQRNSAPAAATVDSPATTHDRAAVGFRPAGAAADSAAEEPLHKVVLARDCVVETDDDIDVRTVLGRLNAEYPSCWTFDVAGLVGATPELLIGVADGVVTSRVLAGTYRVSHDPAAELDAARAQLGAAKDSAEHSFAIESLAAALRPFSPQLHVDAEPHLLQLANVIHLASDARGELRTSDGARPSILDVVAGVHPTAAVGGAPRRTAAAAISGYEGADRGRYAGPVGWIDDRGNGQLGIALRCGQLEARNRIRLWAGAGIMPDSDPAAELAETAAKFAPMLRALGVADGTGS